MTVLYVIRESSAAECSSIMNPSILTVWILSILEKKETFHFEYVMSLPMLMIGTLIYNEILILPCEFFYKNLKPEVLKKSMNESVN